jgi:hypothetical protein
VLLLWWCCAADTRLHTHLWARTAAVGANITLEIGNSNATQAVAAVPWPAAATLSGRLSSNYELFPLVSWGGAVMRAAL